MKTNTIYLVTRVQCVDYEGCDHFIVRAFTNREKAWIFQDECQKQLRNIKPLYNKLMKKQRFEDEEITKKFGADVVHRNIQKNIDTRRKMLESNEWSDMRERHDKEVEELMSKFTYDTMDNGKGFIFDVDSIDYYIEEVELEE